MRLFVGRKMDPKMNEESDETTMKPQEQKDKEKAQNKVKKEFLCLLTEEEKGNLNFIIIQVRSGVHIG